MRRPRTLRGVAPGAFAHRHPSPCRQRRVSGVPKWNAKRGAIVILVDRSAGFGGGGLDRGDDATGLRRRSLPPCQPVPMRAVRGSRRRSSRPIHIGRSGCTGSGAIGDALQLGEGAARSRPRPPARGGG